MDLQLKIVNPLISDILYTSRLNLKLQYGSKIALDKMYVFNIIDLDIYFVQKDIYGFIKRVITIQSWYRKKNNLPKYIHKIIPIKYNKYCITDIQSQMYNSKKKIKVTMISEIHTGNIEIDTENFYFSIKIRHVKHGGYNNILNSIHGGCIIDNPHSNFYTQEQHTTILFTHPYFKIMNDEYKRLLLSNLRLVN